MRYARAVTRKMLADAEKLEQTRILLNYVKGHRLEALYSVALAVGLRRGEACALAWPDVDLEAGMLTIRRILQRIKAVGKRGALKFSEMPKNASSRRFIPLPPMVFDR